MEGSPILGRIALSEAALCTGRQSIIPKHFYENSLSRQLRMWREFQKNNGMNKTGCTGASLVFV